MSLPRRSLRGAALLLVLVLGAGGCRKKEEGPEAAAGAKPAGAGKIETQAVAGDLPGGAVVVVSAYDLESFWTKLKATRLFQQLDSIPEIKAKLDPKQNPKFQQMLQQFQTATGAPLNEQTLFHTLGKKFQLGVYAQGADTTAPRMILVADAGDKDALASILTNLKTSAGASRTFKNETFKGVDVTVVSDSGGHVRGLYGFHKEKLVVASDQAGFENAVGTLDGSGATMSADTLYARALSHVGNASMTVFVRKDATRALLASARRSAGSSAQAAQADRALEVADRYNVQSAFVAAWGWVAQGLEVRTYAMLDPSSPGAAPLREMLTTPPSEIELAGYFPDSTLAFYGVNFLDAPKIYDFAVAYAKDIASVADSTAGPQAPARVDSAIAAFQRESGLDIRTDILGWMGKEAAFGLNGVAQGGFFPIPEVSLVIQASDPARAQAFFQKLETRIAAAVQKSPQAFPVQFQEEDYKGVKIRFAPTPMGESLAPAYTIHDDYALVALSRGTLKRMLDAKTGGRQPVRANPRYQEVGSFFPSQANVVGFLDFASFLREIRSAVTAYQQMSGRGGSPQEQDTMNRLLAALSNIQAVASYGVNDAAGLEQRFLVRIQ